MTKKYRVYDNYNEGIVFETDDIHELNMNITIHYPLGDFISIVNNSDKDFILYFENYTIKMKK